MLEKKDSMKIGRNDLCWCKSQKKYKQCHMAMDEKIAVFQRNGAKVPDHSMIKTKEQIEGIRKAGAINTKILDYLEPFITEGISTEEINTMVHEYTIQLGGVPATLGYKGFPKSVCTSINEVVCHGIPDPNRILKEGDIINIDTTTIVDGYYGDASRMYAIGEIGEEKKKLMHVAKECLDLGLEEVKPWGFLGDIGAVIQEHAKENGYTIVRQIGGHGVGLQFHEDPWVSHIGKRGTDFLLVPGMIFTIEPMVNMGKADILEDKEDGWTIYTEDKLPSAQWEYTVLVTETGKEILSY